MMSREFTRREKLLLIIMCILLIGILYFQFVYKPVKENIKKYDTSKLETTLLKEQTKAANIKKMNTEMATNKASNVGVVATYNNVKKELSALNTIFASASSFNLEFADPVKDGDAVRRNVNITFTTGSYTTANTIIRNLHNCKYRCLIRTVSLTKGDGGVSGTMQVTFFETLYGAKNADGLTDASSSTQGTTSSSSSTSTSGTTN